MAIMSDGIVAEVADRLWQAEITRSPISPITEAWNPGPWCCRAA